jgi:hypothetical protein
MNLKNYSAGNLASVSAVTFFLILFTLSALRANGQTCQDPPRDELSRSWPNNSPIHVNVSTAFSGPQNDAIKLAFNNWSNAATSGITFTFTYTGTPLNPNDLQGWQVNYTGTPHCAVGGYACQSITGGQISNLSNRRATAWTDINTLTTNTTAITQAMAHEIGHTFGLYDCSACLAGQSTMTSFPSGDYNNTTWGQPAPTICDKDAAWPYYHVATCTYGVAKVEGLCTVPNYSPRTAPDGYCCPSPGQCNGPQDYVTFTINGCSSGFVGSGGSCTRSSAFISRCEDRFGGYDDFSCGCNGGCELGGSCSPIVVDILGNGFELTDAVSGVNFDLDNTGAPERIGWTAASSDDAWLVLDRNGDGLINGGKELFGNATAQSPPVDDQEMNGFRALAEFDTADFGGNEDGKIDYRDSVFSYLKLWQDANHNGISETCEMSALSQLGLREFDLKYKFSWRMDEFGNQFRYRGKVDDAHHSHLGRWAWDVFLVTQP